MHMAEAYAPLSAIAVCTAEEGLSGGVGSALCLASGMSHIENGVFYAEGGIGRVASSLIHSIQSQGGIVYDEVPVEQIALDGEGKERRAVGVEIRKDSTVSPSTGGAVVADDDEIILYASKSVVSGAGVLCTYVNLLCAEYVSYSVRASLSGLHEMTPKMYAVYWLRGSASVLGLSDADYTETTSQGTSDEGREPPTYFRVWSPSSKDPSWITRYAQ